MWEEKGETDLKENQVISPQEIREGNLATSLKEMEAMENPVTNLSTMQQTNLATNLSNKVLLAGSPVINLNSKVPQEGNLVINLKEMEEVVAGPVTDLLQLEVQETANLPIRTICKHLQQHK